MRRMLWPSLLLLAGPCLAATISIGEGGRALYVALDDPEAACAVEDDVVRCTGGGRYVAATVEDGCGDSYGPTYCASVDPRGTALVASEVRCPHGGGYVLVGGSGDVRCARDGDGLRCASADGASFAAASCASGCLETRGAGVCCAAGTAGCPPGIPGDE